MKVPCADIARFIKEDLAKQVTKLKKKKITPKLVSILIGDSPGQLSLVKAKQKIARELGIEFKSIHLNVTPPFLEFANLLKDTSNDPTVTGVVIEQPLPITLQSETLYDFIPLNKEIEGHRKKTQFHPPIGITILTLLKYIYQNTKLSTKLYPDPKVDPGFFKQALKQKRVVLIGSGATAGQPIAKVLSGHRVNFINVNSNTFEPEQYYKDADIIITAVGKKVIDSAHIKQGIVLLNVGLHSDKNGVTGDYDENDIKSKASFYTPTPKGTGPLDILYLFKNLIDATTLQNQK